MIRACVTETLFLQYTIVCWCSCNNLPTQIFINTISLVFYENPFITIPSQSRSSRNCANKISFFFLYNHTINSPIRSRFQLLVWSNPYCQFSIQFSPMPFFTFFQTWVTHSLFFLTIHDLHVWFRLVLNVSFDHNYFLAQ